MATDMRERLGADRFRWESSVLLLGKVALALFVGFAMLMWLFPILYGFWASVHENVVASAQFVGLGNYADVIAHDLFWKALNNTVVFAVVTTFTSVGLGLLFALAVNQGIRGGSLARTLILFPYLIPTVVIAFLWQFMLNQNTGVVNELLVGLGVLDEGIRFFGTTEWAMPAVIAMSTWVYAAFAFFILLAQLQSIDSALYERATVEGANAWEKFRDITYPHIRTTLLLVVFLRGIWLFNHFDLIFIATRGGPINETLTIPLLIYKLIFEEFSYGQGAALGSLLFFLLAIGAVVYFKLLNKGEVGAG
jgi:multiple sugar transport system permease protein